jgi:hypothetical protein
MAKTIMTVDPGKFKLAVAIGDTSQRLTYCGLFTIPKRTTFPALLAMHSEHVAELVRRWKVDELVVEKPMIYPRAPARQADVLELGMVAAACVAAPDCVPPPAVPMSRHLVPAVQWKGSVPKGYHQARLMGKLPSLWCKRIHDSSPGRKDQRDHNIVDAVGLLWYWLQGTGVT